MNYDIEHQSEEELQIIMRSIYLQFSKNSDNEIQKQIKDLNAEVLKYSIENIYTNVKQYLGYLRNCVASCSLLLQNTSLFCKLGGYHLVGTKGY